MHFAWPSLDQAEQECAQHYTICQLFVLHFTQYLAFKVAFTTSARVNGGMSDWFE
jgi:hypothetical protein